MLSQPNLLRFYRGCFLIWWNLNLILLSIICNNQMFIPLIYAFQVPFCLTALWWFTILLSVLLITLVIRSPQLCLRYENTVFRSGPKPLRPSFALVWSIMVYETTRGSTFHDGLGNILSSNTLLLVTSQATHSWNLKHNRPVNVMFGD